MINYESAAASFGISTKKTSQLGNLPKPKKLESYSDVPGFNNDTHLDNLMALARTLPENSKVLEIGCAWGGSTWALLDSLPKGCELHVCDTFGMNDPRLKTHHYNGVMKKHSHNTAVSYAMHLYLETNHRTVWDWCMKQHPRFNEVIKTVHQKPSVHLLQEDVEWDMAYIDGFHSYENVSKELEYLKNVKVLCGDDYHPAHPGCKQAIDEFVAKQKDREFTHDDFETGSGFWKAIYV